jgi:phosphatidylglycerol:prolipoprotein diacylglycerol transferase
MIRFLFDGIYVFPSNGDPWRLVAYYGIIIMLGAVAGAWLAAREVKRRGHDPEIVWDLLVYLIIGGVIGARLWHIFTPSPSTLVLDPTTQEMVNPYFIGGVPRILDIINLRKGGLGIPGAVIGGAIALYFYSRKFKLNFAEWADIAAPSLALGQAIGRWGNYFNQELYGAPTNLPWKIYIEPRARLSGFENYDYFHPLFLYESLWNFANVFFLLWLARRFGDRLKTGDVLLVYLVTYPIGRFLLDFLRLDASQLGGINVNQTFMAIVAVVSAAALILRHLPSRKTA